MPLPADHPLHIFIREDLMKTRGHVSSGNVRRPVTGFTLVGVDAVASLGVSALLDGFEARIAKLTALRKQGGDVGQETEDPSEEPV